MLLRIREVLYLVLTFGARQTPMRTVSHEVFMKKNKSGKKKGRVSRERKNAFVNQRTENKDLSLLSLALEVLGSRMVNLCFGLGLTFFGVTLWVTERMNAPAICILPLSFGLLFIGAFVGQNLDRQFKKNPLEMISI